MDMAAFSDNEEEHFSTPLSTIESPIMVEDDTHHGSSTSVMTSGYDTEGSMNMNKTFTVSKFNKQGLIKKFGCKPFQVEAFLNVCKKIEKKHPGGLQAWFGFSSCKVQGDKRSGVTVYPTQDGKVLLDLKDLVARLI